ncbi:hypothetical protein F5Y17DRAFT_12582 [Xylariaceae sp. FL0594]|nr:hypothetical protein F5Y17DRAFT_12582 [Xylariaceae sp. FL0594]
MPSRLSIPKLSLFSSRSSRRSSSSSSTLSSAYPPSNSTSPAKRSNNTTTTPPISPPPRLHLRNILPSSPEAPAIMPPPPRKPRAWVWQCHYCLTVYRLGCTRRCLDCSHTYCVSVNPQPDKTSRGKRRRRRASGMCAAEFDYIGWEQWGSWRRKVLGYEATGRCDQKARDRAYLYKRHDCYLDCDSPSECCHRRYELLKEDYVMGMTNEPRSPSIVVNAPGSPADDELPLNETIELAAEGEKDFEDETSPKSPLGQSSFSWDEIDLEEKQEKVEESVWWAGGIHFEPVIPGLDTQKLAGVKELDNPVCTEDPEERPVSRLSVRNQSDEELFGDSDSDPESGYSDWSSVSFD